MDGVANHIATNFKSYKCKICTCRYIIIIFLFIGFQSVRGQENILDYPLNINITNYPVFDILRIIEKEVGYNFSYNADIINTDKIVSISSQDNSLRKILNFMLDDSTLIYKVIGRHIVILKPGTEIREFTAKHTSDSMQVFEIRGTVIDNDSRKPVEYANICIIGKPIGTVSNADGDFILRIPASNIGDTVGISFIGYQTSRVPVIDYLPGMRIISLIPDYIPIQEVIIRKIDPISLLRDAFDNIPVNYTNTNSLLTSFYRESVRTSDRYIIVGEAVIQTFKSPYSSSYKTDQIKIIKARTSKDISNTDTIIMKLKGGLSTTLLLDIVKFPANFLIPDYFYQYRYKMADVMIDNEKKAYVIKFDQKEGVDNILFSGKIYLDLNSLAIKGVDFSLNKYRIEKVANYFIVKKPRFFKVKPLKAEYQVKFRELNNKYYLNFIRCETEFRIRRKRKLFSKVFNTVIEMAVTDIDTTDVKRFKVNEVAKTMNVFTEEASEYDDAFWEEYNFIKPDEPLEQAIKRLNPRPENSGD